MNISMVWRRKCYIVFCLQYRSCSFVIVWLYLLLYDLTDMQIYWFVCVLVYITFIYISLSLSLSLTYSLPPKLTIYLSMFFFSIRFCFFFYFVYYYIVHFKYFPRYHRTCYLTCVFIFAHLAVFWMVQNQ